MTQASWINDSDHPVAEDVEDYHETDTWWREQLAGIPAGFNVPSHRPEGTRSNTIQWAVWGDANRAPGVTFLGTTVESEADETYPDGKLTDAVIPLTQRDARLLFGQVLAAVEHPLPPWWAVAGLNQAGVDGMLANAKAGKNAAWLPLAEVPAPHLRDAKAPLVRNRLPWHTSPREYRVRFHDKSMHVPASRRPVLIEVRQSGIRETMHASTGRVTRSAHQPSYLYIGEPTAEGTTIASEVVRLASPAVTQGVVAWGDSGIGPSYTPGAWRSLAGDDGVVPVRTADIKAAVRRIRREIGRHDTE